MPATVALLTGYVQHQGDAWAYTVDAVGRYLERVLAARPELADREAVQNIIGAIFPERVCQLGRRLAEMHLALAGDPDDPAFAPEPFTTLYQRSLYQALRGQVRRTVRLLDQMRDALEDDARAAAIEIVRRESVLLERFSALHHRKITAAKIAVHGGFHLGQALNTGKDFVITDLEGDPSRRISERSLKRSPLRDVASLMRSFDYAAHSACKRQHPDELQFLAPWVKVWTRAVSDEFLASYVNTAQGALFLPSERADLNLLIDVYLVDRAAEEINNELIYRPAMAPIPILALRELLDHPTSENRALDGGSRCKAE
jgi:maltose alpha-D-glucosyltransferase/alpha-amylase